MACLIPTYVYVWNTKHPGKRIGVAYLNTYLLNPNRVVDMTVCSYGGDTTASKFLFANDPDDRRDSPDTIIASETNADFIAYMDYDSASKFGTLPIFPDMDITQVAVDTTIEWENVAYMWQTNRDYADDVTRMVYYPEAWKRVECIIDKPLADIWFYQGTGLWIG